eukprot:GFUD01134689.1.p1 GENE.GFUD01134689.1~~GFUD01134689.1.p1  ORF type:complete len:517 (-),score=144.01 GFUD01134689.1:28-1371(-)
MVLVGGILNENWSVELKETKGNLGEMWHMQKIIEKNPEELNTVSVTVACRADLNFVLAEEKGMLVLQKERENADEQVWQVVLEGGNTTIIDDTTFQIPLPDVDLIPEGFENITKCLVNVPDGTKESFWVWVDAKEKTIGIIYKNVSYSLIMDREKTKKSVVTLNEGKIVSIDSGELMPSLTLEELLKLNESWTKEAIEQVATLTARGIITKLEKMQLNADLLSAEDVDAALPTMPLARVVALEGITLTSSQWEKVEEILGCQTEHFGLGGGITIDTKSAEVLARVCKKTKEVLLLDVHFEDICSFLTDVGEVLYEEEGRCEQIIFGKETAGRYKQEVQEMGQKLGWNLLVDDEEECIKLQKDDKMEERQREYRENAWKNLNDKEQIDCLKMQVDFLEKKVDTLTKFVEKALGMKEQVEGRNQTEFRQLQHQMNEMQHRALRERQRRH